MIDSGVESGSTTTQQEVEAGIIAAGSVTRILLGGGVSVSDTDTYRIRIRPDMPWIRFYLYPEKTDTYLLGYAYPILLGQMGYSPKQ